MGFLVFFGFDEKGRSRVLVGELAEVDLPLVLMQKGIELLQLRFTQPSGSQLILFRVLH